MFLHAQRSAADGKNYN